MVGRWLFLWKWSFLSDMLSFRRVIRPYFLGGRWHRRGTICFASPWYAFIWSPKDLFPKCSHYVCLQNKNWRTLTRTQEKILYTTYIYGSGNVETRSSQTIPMRPYCQEAFMERQLWRQKWHILGRNSQGFQGFWWFQHVIASWLAPPQSIHFLPKNSIKQKQACPKESQKRPGSVHQIPASPTPTTHHNHNQKNNDGKDNENDKEGPGTDKMNGDSIHIAASCQIHWEQQDNVPWM